MTRRTPARTAWLFGTLVVAIAVASDYHDDCYCY